MAWRNKKIYILVVILTLSIFFVFYFLAENEPKEMDKYKELELKGKNIFVEIAGNSRDHYLGLSNREKICADCGMLFVFPEKEIRKFVMRNMKFPLDIVFIDDNEIVSIFENLNPEGAEPINIYSSATPVNNVLEVPAGYCQKNNVKIGDEIKINNNQL